TVHADRPRAASKRGFARSSRVSMLISNSQATGERHMAHLRWTEDAVSVGGVCERGFAVERNGSVIPGVLWYPAEASTPQPLVLLGHGGGAHKRNDRMVMLGRMLGGDYGLCC